MKIRLLIPFLFITICSEAQESKSFFFGIQGEKINRLTPDLSFSYQGLLPDQQFTCALMIDSVGNLILYQSDITTAVCKDTLCQLASCTIFWDITGKYLGFSIDEKEPLTKFDHKKFRTDDYIKLHQLLLDQHSVLSQKRMEEIIDPATNLSSSKYDVTTGATALELKGAVVEQASYTSYTFWYLANGSVCEKIRQFTEKSISRTQVLNLLYSTNPREQLLALESIQEADYHTEFEQLLHILSLSIPLNKQFILKNLPREIWKQANNQLKICQTVEHLDSRSISVLLQQLQSIRKPSTEAITHLSYHLERFSRTQLKTYRLILEKQFRKIPKPIQENLQKLKVSTRRRA